MTESGTEDDAATIGAVTEAMRAFSKALRANQLYLPNNPTRHRATEVAQSMFQQLWSHIDTVVLHVRETELLWNGHSVYRDTERGTDALPFLLYRDGLRELQFSPEFETAEMPVLLSLLQRAKSASPNEDDLVTLLWVADLQHVRHRHVEMGSESVLLAAGASAVGIAAPDAGLLPLGAPSSETSPPGAGPPPGIVRLEDFDSTLYFLDPSELSYLNNEVRRAYETDGKRDVIDILMDIAELQTADSASARVLGVLQALTIELLVNGEYDHVAHLLREAKFSATRSSTISVEARDGLMQLSAQLSEPAVMTQLLQAVDDGEQKHSSGTLETMFAELRPSALPTLLAWLAVSTSSPMRSAVEQATTVVATANVSDLVALLDHDDPNVVREAVRFASVIGSAAAVPGLARLLRGNDVTLRTDAVVALGEIASAGAMQAIERAIEDSEREIRVAALRAIANNRHANALPRLSTLLGRKELRQIDLVEKVALFEAYGMLCGDEGVSTLDSMLNGRSLLAFREPPESRACAARALGIVGTPAALSALQRSADTKEVVVRTAVQRAMRANP